MDVDAMWPSVLFITLGCAKNEVDTDRMRARLLNVGCREVTRPGDADIILINTCSFLASATSESIEATLELAEELQSGVRAKPLVMCGCVPSRYGVDVLAKELPEVTAFVPVAQEDDIVRIVADVCGVSTKDASFSDAVASRALRTVEGAIAYIKISDGCDRRCAFCAIPGIRGRYASRPYDELAAESTELLEGGVRELVLIGQDTGVWGHDLPGAPTLAWLLRKMAALARPFGAWVRVLYLQPEGMTDELIETIRDTPEVLRYIDIPIQHCARDVLASMGRTGDEGDFRRLFAHLRQQIPDMVLRTTVMAGFPGETERHFEELLAFLQAEHFDYTSVFSFSPEEGTRAARMDEQVSDSVKLERTQALMDVAEELGFAATAEHVGEIGDVLIDGIEQTPAGSELIGHAWFQAPDSDGAVHIEHGEAAVGDMVTCRFVDSFCYELIGEIVEEGG